MAGRPAAVKLTEEQWSMAAFRAKEYRRIHGLSQSELAAKVGGINQQICQIERGSKQSSSRIAAKILELSLEII